MSVENFSTRLQAKRDADAILRSRTDDLFAAQNILVAAVEQMRETVGDEDVVKMLRRAIDLIES